MSKHILRLPAAAARLGVGMTKFKTDFILHSTDDPFVKDTSDVLRLRRVPLGGRAVGLLSDEIDALVAGLKRWRDRNPLPPPQPPPLVRQNRKSKARSAA